MINNIIFYTTDDGKAGVVCGFRIERIECAHTCKKGFNRQCKA